MYVSDQKDLGTKQHVVIESVGHSSEAMSEHYTHASEEAIVKAAQARKPLCWAPIALTA
jgi:hypothetical protein